MAKQRSTPAALAIAVGIFLSRIAGLIRERVLAHFLGSSLEAGAFRAALRIPNLLQNLFGEGALSASFIPIYSKLRAEGKDAEAERLATAIFLILCMLVLLLVGLGVLSAQALIDLLAPGFEGEARELTVDLVRIMFPGVGLLVMSAWCLGVLNSHKRFLLPYIAPVLWNVAIIVSLIFAAFSEADAPAEKLAIAAAWGTVAGALLQLGIQISAAWSLAGVKTLRPLWSPATASVIRNFGPATISRGVMQISSYFDQYLASFMGASLFAHYTYAQTLYLLPISLFGISISASELPAMSAITGNEASVKEALRTRLIQNLQRLAFFVLPSLIALTLLGDTVIATLLMSGKFTRSDVFVVWGILAAMSIGLLAATRARLLSTAMWTLQDTQTPMRIAILRVACGAGLGYLILLKLRVAYGYSETWGIMALAAIGGLVAWIEYLSLHFLLQRRLGPLSVGRTFAVKLWAAGLIAGALAYPLKIPLREWGPIPQGIVILGCFGCLYLGLAYAWHLGEARRLGDAIVRRLRRKS